MASFFPAHVEINYSAIYNGSITNDDGHGWAVASARLGMEVGASLKFEESAQAFMDARLRHGEDSLALFHSRFGTHGGVNVSNVHPFYVKDYDTVVAHNGILPVKWHPSKMDPRSDTRVFVDEVMPDFMTPAGIPSRRGGKRLAQMIGYGNKLVILSVHSGKPKVRIVNADMGEHHQGAWYSNTGYISWQRKYGNHSYSDYGWIGGGCSTSSEPRAITAGPAGLEVEHSGSTYFWEGEYYLDSPCEVCLTEGYVNADTMICERCETCNDCWASSKYCECSVGAINPETSMFSEANDAAQRRIEEARDFAYAKRLDAPWPAYPSEDLLDGWKMD